MTKKLLPISLTFTLILTASWTLIDFNKDFLSLWNANRLQLHLDAPLDPDKLKIEYGAGCFSYMAPSEFDLGPRETHCTIFEDGQMINSIPNEYGENDFLITYDDQYVVLFRHFKPNARHQHNYQIKLRRSGEDIIAQVNIEGRDARSFERTMSIRKRPERLSSALWRNL